MDSTSPSPSLQKLIQDIEKLKERDKVLQLMEEFVKLDSVICSKIGFFLFVAPTLQIQAEINSILIQKLVPVFFHSILLVFFVFLATMFFFYKKFNRLFFERKVPNRCDFEQSIILSSFASFISFPPKKKPSVQFAKIFQVLSTQKNGQQTADSMKEYLTKVRTI